VHVCIVNTKYRHDITLFLMLATLTTVLGSSQVRWKMPHLLDFKQHGHLKSVVLGDFLSV
jgi:hypothetical protein